MIPISYMLDKTYCKGTEERSSDQPQAPSSSSSLFHYEGGTRRSSASFYDHEDTGISKRPSNGRKCNVHSSMMIGAMPISYAADKNLDLTDSQRDLLFPPTPTRTASHTRRISPNNSKRNRKSCPPPPGVEEGGVWGRVFHSGALTAVMNALCVVTLGLAGLIASDQPQDLKIVYKLGPNVSDHCQ
jgi:hypothetical protein